MRERPPVPDSDIAAAVAKEFQLDVADAQFLPVGFDVNTAAYRVRSGPDSWFVKIRRGPQRESAALVPHLLAERGCAGVIPPVRTVGGDLSFGIGPYLATMSRFVAGRNAYEARISSRGWQTFAGTVALLHTLGPEVLSELLPGIDVPKEQFGPEVTDAVRSEMSALGRQTPRDATAEDTLRFLTGVRSRIGELADLCDDIGRNFPGAGTTKYVPCHSDLHAGNIHIGTGGNLYVVDWDELVLAPPERDLMFIGGSLLATGLNPSEECSMFYSSYSLYEPQPDLLTYFRIRRILIDIVEFCRLLFGDGGADEDRVDSLEFLRSNFDDGGTIDVALESWR